MKKTILFRRLRNFVYAMMLPGMAMFIGSCSDEPNWERLPDRQRDDVQVRPEVKSDEEWEYSFSVNGLCGEGADSASVFMADWSDRVWVGDVFPEADFGAGFENNIPYPEMSLTLRTDFPQPYVGHCISNGRQSMNYRRYLKSLIHSEEYKDFVRTDSLGGPVEVFYSEYNSPEGTKNIQVVKSRMLVLVLSRRFKVTMDIPDNVSFWEAMKGQTGKNPVYVRSLTYGRAALLMVESEAGFSSLQDAWRNRLEGKDLTLEQQEVFRRSTVSRRIWSDTAQWDANQLFDLHTDIQTIFKDCYSEGDYGAPILCEGAYVKDNKPFRRNR